MSRTNHAKAENEARTAREAKRYAQKIAERDARRQLEQSILEFDKWFNLPITLATLA